MIQYTILSAAYANPERTAVVLQTVEAGAVVASEADTPEMWKQAELLPIGDYRPPSMTYAEKRRAEYPPREDALDALVKKEAGDAAAWTAYVTTCLAIKAKYPKPPGDGGK